MILNIIKIYYQYNINIMLNIHSYGNYFIMYHIYLGRRAQFIECIVQSYTRDIQCTIFTNTNTHALTNTHTHTHTYREYSLSTRTQHDFTQLNKQEKRNTFTGEKMKCIIYVLIMVQRIISSAGKENFNGAEFIVSTVEVSGDLWWSVVVGSGQ